MKNWKRLLALFLSGVMTLSLCACAPAGGEASASPDPSGTPAPSIEVDLNQDVLEFAAGVSPTDVLLTVNGEEVTADLFLYMLAMNCMDAQQYLTYYGRDQTLADMSDEILAETVSMAAYHTVMRQRARELGCLPTDAQAAEINAALTEDIKDEGTTLWGLTPKSMEFIFSIDTYMDNLLDAEVPTVTDEMLNNYVYQTKHILLLTVDMDGTPQLQEDGSYAYPPLDDATVAEKRRQAEDFLTQLQGADDLAAKFDELMNQYSEDGRGADGALGAPDGYTAVPGDMVPEFEAAAFALKPGEISGIVESSYGFHILLRGEVEDIQSYAQDCREYLLDQELFTLSEEAKIVRSDALGRLDPADFFSRLSAYQEDRAAQDEGVG